MIISEIFSLTCAWPASPLASAMSWASPTITSAPSAIAVSPPRRSHNPSEWANTAALATSPSRKIRSLGTNTSSKMTKPSGVDEPLPDTGKSRRSLWRGAYVVLMIFTPGALTGIIAAIEYSSSPAFIALVGMVISS